MSEPFLGELKLVSFNFAPKGWAFCNGQFLPINQNQALFSLFGTTYGGNGQTTFALPDLRSRTPIHWGSGVTIGERAGEEGHTLTLSELPTHGHFLKADTTAAATANVNTPSANASLGQTIGASSQGATFPVSLYSATTPNVQMAPASVSTVGGGQPHPNLQPYLALNWIVALQGIFPSRN